MSSYKAVAASQTGASLAGAGQTGKKGDLLKRIVANVTTAATSQLTLIDGSTSIILIPNNVTITGVHIFDFADGVPSQNGAWTITTGAGVSCIAVGDFG